MQPLQIALLQTPLHWEAPSQNLNSLEEKLKALPEHTHVTILPEMFSTGFSMNPSSLAETMDGEAVAWMKRLSASQKTILTGSVMIREGEKYFNRLLWVLPNGQLGQYDKRHLFGYAGEDQHYAAGTKRLIASVNGWRVNLQICYDLRFPVWARQRSTYDEEGNFQPEYDLLIYVANWPARRSEAWKTLLRARAIENQCYVVGVNRIGADGNEIDHSGDSLIVGPTGEIVYTAESKEELYTTILDPAHLTETRDRFPFLKDADGFMILSDDFPE
jgi:omega-amidase